MQATPSRSCASWRFRYETSRRIRSPSLPRKAQLATRKAASLAAPRLLAAELLAVALPAVVVPRRAAADPLAVVAFLVLAEAGHQVAACLAWAVEGRRREDLCDIC